MDILGLLEPHSAENLSPGLPKKNISGSDHMSLVVELGWQSELSKKASQSWENTVDSEQILINSDDVE
jgi:hypothetical protein